MDTMMFNEYMHYCLKENGKKASEVARASGISENYIYKILSGKKRTGIRDYVIAMCRAADMDLISTQIALILNEMKPLSQWEERDAIIRRCIEDRRSIRLLNQSLEDAGYEELKVRTDV